VVDTPRSLNSQVMNTPGSHYYLAMNTLRSLDSLVVNTPGSQLQTRITPQIFKKIWSPFLACRLGLGEDVWWNYPESKKSRDTVPLTALCALSVYVCFWPPLPLRPTMAWSISCPKFPLLLHCTPLHFCLLTIICWLNAYCASFNPFSHCLFCVSCLTAICHMRHPYKADLGKKWKWLWCLCVCPSAWTRPTK
jgi:hypothetical protein